MTVIDFIWDTTISLGSLDVVNIQHIHSRCALECREALLRRATQR